MLRWLLIFMAIFIFLCGPTRIINCDGGLCYNLEDLFQYYIIITNYPQQIFSTDVFIYLRTFSWDFINLKWSYFHFFSFLGFLLLFFLVCTFQVDLERITELSQMVSQVWTLWILSNIVKYDFNGGPQWVWTKFNFCYG